MIESEFNKEITAQSDLINNQQYNNSDLPMKENQEEYRSQHSQNEWKRNGNHG